MTTKPQSLVPREGHWSHTPFVVRASLVLIGMCEDLLKSLGK